MTEDSFEHIKKLMRIIGGKAIIVDDGKPSFVIINVDEYTDFNCTKNSPNPESEIIENANKDVAIWKSKQKEREMKQLEKDILHKENGNRDIEIVENDTNL